MPEASGRIDPETRLAEWFRTVVGEQSPGIMPGLVRLLLFPLSLLYSAFIEAYKQLFQLGVLRRVQLQGRVVSVGNLTMGGAGKTVAVQAMARALQSAGYRCAILSYGFRSTHPGPYAVVSNYVRVLLPVAEAGDEASLLARSLPGIPVIIGKRRGVSGQAAVDLFQPDFILLDDGFQHWRLRRDIDIVLLDARRPVGNGRVFPAGELRERIGALRRASACILTRCDLASAPELEQARALVHRFAPGAPLYESSHQLADCYRVAPLGENGTTAFVPERLFLVSGIAQNDAFGEAILKSGAIVTGTRFFPDHHRYTASDTEEILIKAVGADAILTTEKDAVKLAELWGSSMPLFAVPVYLGGMQAGDWLRICGVAPRSGGGA